MPFYSIVAVLLAAFVVIPLITILTDSSATSSGSPAEYQKNISARLIFSQIILQAPSLQSEAAAPTFCRMFTAACLLCFWFRCFCSAKKVKAREKISYVCLLGVLYLSFNMNYLNFVWHGFHFPKRFAVQIFIYVLVCAARYGVQGSHTHKGHFQAKKYWRPASDLRCSLFLSQKNHI